MDVSGSVSTTEFDLQRTGYANASQSAAVQSAIASTTNGVAVRLFSDFETAITNKLAAEITGTGVPQPA